MPELHHLPAIDAEYDDVLVRVIELEAKEVAESFRWLATQLVQVATVLSVANLTALGYASTSKQAGMFLPGALITVILLVAYQGGIMGAVPLLCRLMALEKQMGVEVLHRPVETAVSLMFLNIFGAEFLSEARKVSAIEDPNDKHKAMRRLGRDLFKRRPASTGLLILVLVTIVEFALVPVLVLVFKWQLF